MPSSRGSSRQGLNVHLLHCRQILYCWATEEAHCNYFIPLIRSYFSSSFPPILNPRISPSSKSRYFFSGSQAEWCLCCIKGMSDRRGRGEGRAGPEASRPSCPTKPEHPSGWDYLQSRFLGLCLDWIKFGLHATVLLLYFFVWFLLLSPVLKQIKVKLPFLAGLSCLCFTLTDSCAQFF